MTLTPESLGTAPGRGRLTGRRIVVVGAGTRPSEDPHAPIGNGRGIAVLCAREGADVACVDIDKGSAQRTASLCEQEGVKAVTIVADVRDADACEGLVHEAHERLGGLDGAVANVGFGAGAGLASTSPELWDDIFALNVRSHFLVARAALPVLEDGSSIVFIGVCRQPAGRHALPGVRRIESSSVRALPSRRARGCAARHSREPRDPWAGRHAARSLRERQRRTTLADPSAAVPPGHGSGYCLCDGIHVEWRSQLHHGRIPRCRWGTRTDGLTQPALSCAYSATVACVCGSCDAASRLRGSARTLAPPRCGRS